MNAFKSALCAAALAACATAGAASAAERTTTFEVFLEVGQMCEFTGTTNVDFGTPSPASGNQIDAYGSLRVYCNLPIAYGISLDAGQHGSGTGDRKMASASGATIDYRLYSGSDGDVSCSEAGGVQWGDSSGGCIYSSTYQASEQVIEIHGALNLVNPAAGTYSDTVTATITY